MLPEAAQGPQVLLTAPGSDIAVARSGGGYGIARGTSFAAPLVAGTIALAYPEANPARRAQALASVDARADRRGKPYGRGLVCAACATFVK